MLVVRLTDMFGRHLRWGPLCTLRWFSSVATKYGRSSSSQWLNRQSKDKFTSRAKLLNYRSRAAFKIQAIDDKYHILKPGMTVVDLGFAPGSWSQVAVERTGPEGRVIGVDLLFCQPPKGVTSIQGNFLSPKVQQDLKQLLIDPGLAKKRTEKPIYLNEHERDQDLARQSRENQKLLENDTLSDHSYLDNERLALDQHDPTTATASASAAATEIITDEIPDDKYNVDVVLSDMCEPLPQENGFWLRSVNDPYIRMANTSGLQARDHAASIVSPPFI